MMKQNETESKPQALTCNRCGTAFVCGLAAGQAVCWCFHLPQVQPVPQDAAAGCWCAACLQAVIDETQTHDAD